ncbi:uncharacterized protein K441DRAFT_681406 [Cenococcum geophilum 1.58]|uniref:uncharacterized protein n=1 Tax=Cenococcum geophilum 1.58 TaxID=794803 RepID=UPI00358DFA39|nr:hypothetical protein K441DRAFT_681406 [Cenococcum geophilum 1.58]
MFANGRTEGKCIFGCRPNQATKLANGVIGENNADMGAPAHDVVLEHPFSWSVVPIFFDYSVTFLAPTFIWDISPSKEETWFKRTQGRMALLGFISDRLADIASHCSQGTSLKGSPFFRHCFELFRQFKGYGEPRGPFGTSRYLHTTILDDTIRARPEPKPPP